MMPSLPSSATPRALGVAAAHQHSALKNTVNASSTPLLRPEHLRVRFNDRVYVSFIPESEPWIDDGLGRGNNNAGLPCNDHNDEDPDQEEDIADLVAGAKSFEENQMVRREQLARGNMVTSPPPFEQDELSLVEGRCPMSPELMTNFEIYLEHVNSKPSKMRQARKWRKRRSESSTPSSALEVGIAYVWPDTLSVPAQAPATRRPWNVTPRKDMSVRATMPLVISKTGSIAGAGTTTAFATGEHSVLEGPATPPEGVASTSYGVGMGLPSTLGTCLLVHHGSSSADLEV